MKTRVLSRSTVSHTDSLQKRPQRFSLFPLQAAFAFFIDQVQFWIRLPFTLFLRPTEESPEVDEERIEATVADIHRLLRVALSAGVDQDLTAALNKLARNRSRIERAIVVWTDLIEMLVQYEERRYGPRAGLGRIKAAELKQIFKYLLRNQKFKLPNIPDALQPLVTDYVIDWIVDAVVTANNSYGLWEEVETRPGYPFRVFLAQVKSWLGRIFSPLLAGVVGIILWIRRSLAASVILSPEIKGAIDAVEKEGMIADSDDLIKEVVNLIVFVGEHAKQVKAGFELVLTAVQEAETFASLSGPEKKRYATNLIFAVLEELGFVEDDGFLGAVIETLISAGIEVAVHLFSKRGVFAN